MQECDVQSGLLAALTRALKSEALWEMWFCINVRRKEMINYRFNMLHYPLLYV